MRGTVCVFLCVCVCYSLVSQSYDLVIYLFFMRERVCLPVYIHTYIHTYEHAHWHASFPIYPFNMLHSCADDIASCPEKLLNAIEAVHEEAETFIALLNDPFIRDKAATVESVINLLANVDAIRKEVCWQAKSRK